MANMSLKLNPTSMINARLGIEPNGKAHDFFTNSCYKYMDKYVPMDNGDLRTKVDIQTDRITYESRYAHAQYVGFTKGPIVNYTTPGTGPYWDKRMVSAEMQDVVKEVQDYVKRGGK